MPVSFMYISLNFWVCEFSFLISKSGIRGILFPLRASVNRRIDFELPTEDWCLEGRSLRWKRQHETTPLLAVKALLSPDQTYLWILLPAPLCSNLIPRCSLSPHSSQAFPPLYLCLLGLLSPHPHLTFSTSSSSPAQISYVPEAFPDPPPQAESHLFSSDHPVLFLQFRNCLCKGVHRSMVTIAKKEKLYKWPSIECQLNKLLYSCILWRIIQLFTMVIYI